MNPKEEEIDFQDMENFSGNIKSGFTFKQVVLEQLNRIAKLGSMEWKGGHFEERPVNINGVTKMSKVYMPDSKKEMINAINILRMLLLPHYDKEMQDAVKPIEEEKKALTKECEQQKADGIDKADIDMHFFHKTLEIQLQLFEALSGLLQRKKYFEGLRSSDAK